MTSLMTSQADGTTGDQREDEVIMRVKEEDKMEDAPVLEDDDDVIAVDDDIFHESMEGEDDVMGSIQHPTTSRIRVSDSWQDEAKSEMSKRIQSINRNYERGTPFLYIWYTSVKEVLCLPPFANGSRIYARELAKIFEMGCAYVHGGVDRSNRPLLCLPSFPTLHLMNDADFRDLLLYLANMKRSSAFVALIDRRKEGWLAVRTILQRLASRELRYIVEKVIVLRPEGFLRGTISNIGLRFESLPFQVILLPNTSDLDNHVDRSQLTKDFGGKSIYYHRTWIENRMALEGFALRAMEVGGKLDDYGSCLANTQLPNDSVTTRTLLDNVQKEIELYQKEIIKMEKDFVRLRSVLMKNVAFQELLHKKVKEDLICLDHLVEETKITFHVFCKKHLTKLRQCLQLRRFEQEYKEINSYLDDMLPWVKIQTIGINMNQINSLLEVLQEKEELLLKIQSRINRLQDEGEKLISNQHYAVDCIKPKCEEIIRKTNYIKKELKGKVEETNQALDVVSKIEKMSSWCDDVIKILAEQPAEEIQSMDTAKSAFEEINDVLTVSDLCQDVTDSCDSTELLNLWQDTEKRVAGVKRLCEKRLTSMKKGLARLNDRPVQKVEPTTKPRTRHDSGANRKMNQSPNCSPKTTPKRSQQCNNRKSKTCSNKDGNPVIDDRLRHVMDELLTTERAYIQQIQSVIEGYIRVFEHAEKTNTLPDALKGKKDILFGNLPAIFQFHHDKLLPKLEENINSVEGTANVFINHKMNFQIYGEYCRNSSRSEYLRNIVGEHHLFFLQCQRNSGHPLPLGAYLLKPIQRVTKYQLLLEQMLKSCEEECKEFLQSAVETMLNVTKSINDKMHEAAISGYQDDLNFLGTLLLQGAYTIQVERRKEKSKKSRFSGKSLQRHVFLYEKELVLCKQQNREASNSTAVDFPISGIVVDGKEQIYQFKRSIKWNEVEISDAVGDKKKFEIWCTNEVVTVALPSVAIRQEWMKQIRNISIHVNKRPLTPAMIANVRRSNSMQHHRNSSSSSQHPKEERTKSRSMIKHVTSIARSPSVGRKAEERKKISLDKKQVGTSGKSPRPISSKSMSTRKIKS